MKILHIVPGLPFGGIQRLVADLAEEQLRQSIDVAVLSIYDSQPFIRLLRERAIPTHLVPGQGPSFGAIAKFVREIDRVRPSVIHLHSGLLWTNSIGLATKECPWIFHAHNYRNLSNSPKAVALNAVIGWLSDGVIAVSDAVAATFKNHMRAVPIKTVYNAVRPLERPHNHAQEFNCSAPRFGMATRFAEEKGVMEFIDVAKRILKPLPNARFAIAGDGPLRPKAQDRVRELGLSGCFELPGFVSDIERFWGEVDIAIFTAATEPFGLRLIEPMAYGIPVASYMADGGAREILKPDVNALVVPVGAVDQLVAAAVRLVQERAVRDALRNTAYEDVKARFSLPTMERKIREVYAAVLHAQ